MRRGELHFPALNVLPADKCGGNQLSIQAAGSGRCKNLGCQPSAWKVGRFSNDEAVHSGARWKIDGGYTRSIRSNGVSPCCRKLADASGAIDGRSGRTGQIDFERRPQPSVAIKHDGAKAGDITDGIDVGVGSLKAGSRECCTGTLCCLG